MEQLNKVFGIGLSHTGTSSLNAALEVLGIPSRHWPTDRRTFGELSNGIYTLSLLNRYQALTDITAVPYYAQFDHAYPNSRFILTLRDPDKWAKRMMGLMPVRKTLLPSTLRKYVERLMMFTRRHGGIRRFILSSAFVRYIVSEPGIVRRIEFQEIATYGGLRFRTEERLRYVFELHRRNTLEYFKGRPDDLLVFDVFAGDGWTELCAFLNRAVPDVPFPHVGWGAKDA